MTGSPSSHRPSATGTASPRVLVADDDPASRRFLCDGLRSLGAVAEASTDGCQALRLATADAFDLLLLDCRMPGMGALQVLAALRSDARALSAASVAVATTAEPDPRFRQPLLDAGFRHILLKPCGLHELHQVMALVRTVPALDDGAALAASGDAGTMQALRMLLRGELAALEQELPSLSRDRAALGERLHRLRSSCGFCGATALSVQTVALQQQLSRQEPTSPALAGFREALRSTLLALDTSDQT